MKPVVLLVGRLPGVIGAIAQQLQDLPVEWLGLELADHLVAVVGAGPTSRST